MNEIVRIPFKFHWSLILRVQLTIFQHWFRKLLGADQATSHYLNQWWSNLLTYICVTRLLCDLKRHKIMYLWGRHNDQGEVIEWNAPVCLENLSSEKSQLQFKHGAAHKDWLQASTKLSQHFLSLCCLKSIAGIHRALLIQFIIVLAHMYSQRFSLYHHSKTDSCLIRGWNLMYAYVKSYRSR